MIHYLMGQSCLWECDLHAGADATWASQSCRILRLHYVVIHFFGDNIECKRKDGNLSNLLKEIPMKN